MIIARFNSADYKLEGRPVLTFSASETTFSEIVIDFTGKTAADLPIKYQEIQVVDTGTPDVVLYYGYCSQPSLPAFNGSQGRVLLTIELMSPQTYLTKRTIDLRIAGIGIRNAVIAILYGVISNDGFTIGSIDLPQTELLSELYSNQTIESILTNLGGRFGFIWYVNELKKIYIKYLPNIETKAAVYSLTDPLTADLKSVQPYFNVSDYANRLNFSNVTLINDQTLLTNSIALTDGESYQFAYPFSLSSYVLSRELDTIIGTPPAGTQYIFGFAIGATLHSVSINISTQVIIYSAGVGFSGVDDGVAGKVILLERDASNPNIITGVKYVGVGATLNYCVASTALQPCIISYLDPVEIANSKAKINTSGIVEKSIDINGKYFTYKEMTAYAKTLFRQNNKQADVVDLVFQGNNLSTIKSLLIPTAKIYIDLPDQFITGSDYVIISGEYSINQNIYTLSVQCKRANLSENYIDIFRKESGEKNESQSHYINYYSQDENTIISKKVIVDGEEVDV